MRLLSRITANAAFSNSAAENTLFTFTVPAYTLGTNGMMRLVLLGTILNNSGANRTYTFRAKWGGTNYIADAATAVPTSATARAFKIELILQGDGSDSAQVMAMSLVIGPVSAATTGTGDFAAAPLVNGFIIGQPALAQTSDRALAVTIQADAATATQTITVMTGYLEDMSS